MSEAVPNEDYLYYASPLYLGKSGITHPCTQAIVAILASALRPKKMTAVIGSWGRPVPVLFLVWDWLIQEITIIPDGFGTHGGEGGRGLSHLLGLIKFYGIPLEQVRMYDKEAFRQLTVTSHALLSFRPLCEAVGRMVIRGESLTYLRNDRIVEGYTYEHL